MAKKRLRTRNSARREARRLFKEAKKVAKKARSELAALTDRLKELIDREPGAKAATAKAAGRCDSQEVQAKIQGQEQPSRSRRRSRAARPRPLNPRPRSRRPRSPEGEDSNIATESAATGSQPTPAPRRSRTSRKSVTNGSVEAVVDATTAGEAPARTSEESVGPETIRTRRKNRSPELPESTPGAAWRYDGCRVLPGALPAFAVGLALRSSQQHLIPFVLPSWDGRLQRRTDEIPHGGRLLMSAEASIEPLPRDTGVATGWNFVNCRYAARGVVIFPWRFSAGSLLNSMARGYL